MDAISSKRVAELLDSMRNRKIAVLGDLMLDRYLWGSVVRISPEAPVPIVEVETESECLGGAANVANNIHSLGATALPIGIIGKDNSGLRLIELARSSGFPTDGIFFDETRPTTVKTRVIAHNQHVVRVDRESKAEISPEITRSIVKFLDQVFPELDAIVLQDYNKGLLTRTLIHETIRLAQKHNITITVDPKFNHFFEYRNVTVFKPNRKETEQALGTRLAELGSLKEAAVHLKERLQCRNLLITLGEKGMLLLAEHGEQVTIPTRAKKVHDVSGAGDTVIGTLTAALSARANILEAATLANFAAGVVVGEVGAVPITRQKLMEAIQMHEKETAGAARDQS